MVDLFANSRDPDQTPQNAVSDLGLHCLLITLLGFSSLPLRKHAYSNILKILQPKKGTFSDKKI